MDLPLESYGRIIYNPKRSLKRNTDWWCILEVSEDFARYYRWHLEKSWYHIDHSSVKREYHRPPHKPHISIIRGEKPRKNIDRWGKDMHGKTVRFRYSPLIRQTSFERDGTDAFFFVKTDFPEFVQLRKMFGLKWESNKGIPFTGHVTVARIMP
ncbi:MAG: hypothetical protein WCY93_07730 [Anaerolineaceae bacterium]